MKLISIRDYAKSKGISYEAVRRQVVKYREDLADHTVRQKGITYLDEDAVKFLDERRRQSPLVIVREDQTAQIEELERQIDALKNTLDVLREENRRSQEYVIELQKDKINFIEIETRYQLLLEEHGNTQEQLKITAAERDRAAEDRDRALTDSSRIREELDQAKTDRDTVKAALEQAQAEASSYTKSIFGFYRRKKAQTP